MWGTSIKAGAAVLKFEKREWTSAAEDRAFAHVERLGQGPERAPFRLAVDSLAKRVDLHLHLFFRLPDADVHRAPAGLLLSDDDDVGDAFLLGVPDLLPEGISGVVQIDADAFEPGDQGAGVIHVVRRVRHVETLGRGRYD